jgi:hypothetical protein
MLKLNYPFSVMLVGHITATVPLVQSNGNHTLLAVGSPTETPNNFQLVRVRVSRQVIHMKLTMFIPFYRIRPVRAKRSLVRIPDAVISLNVPNGIVRNMKNDAHTAMNNWTTVMRIARQHGTTTVVRNDVDETQTMMHGR